MYKHFHRHYDQPTAKPLNNSRGHSIALRLHRGSNVSRNKPVCYTVMWIRFIYASLFSVSSQRGETSLHLLLLHIYLKKCDITQHESFSTRGVKKKGHFQSTIKRVCISDFQFHFPNKQPLTWPGVREKHFTLLTSLSFPFNRHHIQMTAKVQSAGEENVVYDKTKAHSAPFSSFKQTSFLYNLREDVTQ